MKYLSILLILLAGCSGKPKENSMSKVDSIKVYSVWPFSSTPYSLKAKDFFRLSDESDFRRRVINSRDSVDIILGMLEKMQAAPECTATDARAVLLIKYSNHIDTLSGNYACLIYRGKTYKAPEELNKVFWGRSFKIPTFEE